LHGWKVVYLEKHDTKEQAQQRELKIELWKSRIKIQELVAKMISSAGSEYSDYIGNFRDSSPTKLLKKLGSFFLFYNTRNAQSFCHTFVRINYKQWQGSKKTIYQNQKSPLVRSIRPLLSFNMPEIIAGSFTWD
jgi:hypothetical protein